MRKSKRYALFLILLFCIGLTACKDTRQELSGKKEILCTTFPQYDWMRNLIAGVEEQYNLTLLLKNGTDMHSYQMTAEDMIRISNCDMFVYIGGESDNWIDGIQANIQNKNQIQVNLMALLGDFVQEEEHVEGMEQDHEEDAGYDEHIWLSVKNTQLLVSQLSTYLTKMDPSHADIYAANLEKYKTELEELDSQFEEVIENAEYDTLLFGDRFPFRYLTEDYQLNYFAAFAGCSAQTEASFETVAFLAGKLQELKLPAVLIIENSSDKLARSIINSTTGKNQQILTLNSMQSITAEDIANGTTYLSVMRENLDVLTKSLNTE